MKEKKVSTFTQRFNLKDFSKIIKAPTEMADEKPAEVTAAAGKEGKPKACCACPETKKARDAW